MNKPINLERRKFNKVKVLNPKLNFKIQRNMKPDDYGNTMSYELFIRRAYKSIRTRRNGADSFFMEALMNAEHGTVHGGNQDKTLEKVKTFMGKAFEKFLKFKLTDAEKEGLLALKADLDFALSSSQLMDIVTKGLELTHRFKEY